MFKLLTRHFGYTVTANNGRFIYHCFTWSEALAWAACHGPVFGPVSITGRGVHASRF
jgi:hypothetical protein